MRACKWRVGVAVLRRPAWGLALLAAAAPAHAVSVEAIAHCGAEAACLAQLETTAVRDSAGTVQRDGPTLTLQFGLQPPARFVDQGPLVHRYLGKLDGVLLHLVRASAPNQLPAWWLVSESGQPPLKIDALPATAPGGRQFVVASGNGLALYQRSGPRWSLQFRFDGPQGLSWAVKGWRADAAAVKIEWVWPDAPSACRGQAAQGTLQLRDGPYGWDLVPEAPKRCGP